MPTISVAHVPQSRCTGVSLVFFLVGLAIKLGELAGAALNFRLNLLTQAFSLGVLPAVGVGLSRVLVRGGMHPALADGVLILMALPTTVNMCVILTQSAEGVCMSLVKSNNVLPPNPRTHVSFCLCFRFGSCVPQPSSTCWFCHCSTAPPGPHLRLLIAKQIAREELMVSPTCIAPCL